MSHPIRVLIADDEPAARRTIQLLLAGDSDFQVLGECSDGLQTMDANVLQWTYPEPGRKEDHFSTVCFAREVAHRRICYMM